MKYTNLNKKFITCIEILPGTSYFGTLMFYKLLSRECFFFLALCICTMQYFYHRAYFSIKHVLEEVCLNSCERAVKYKLF